MGRKVEQMDGFSFVRKLAETSAPKISRMQWVLAHDPVGVTRCGWCGVDHVVEVQHGARLSIIQHAVAYEELPETTLKGGHAVPDPSGRTWLMPKGICEGTWRTPGEGPPPNPTEREKAVAELIDEHVSWCDTDYGAGGFMEGIAEAARAVVSTEPPVEAYVELMEAFSRELDVLASVARNLLHYADNPRVQHAQGLNLEHSIEKLRARIAAVLPPALAEGSAPNPEGG